MGGGQDACRQTLCLRVYRGTSCVAYRDWSSMCVTANTPVERILEAYAYILASGLQFGDV